MTEAIAAWRAEPVVRTWPDAAAVPDESTVEDLEGTSVLLIRATLDDLRNGKVNVAGGATAYRHTIGTFGGQPFPGSSQSGSAPTSMQRGEAIEIRMGSAGAVVRLIADRQRRNLCSGNPPGGKKTRQRPFRGLRGSPKVAWSPLGTLLARSSPVGRFAERATKTCISSVSRHRRAREERNRGTGILDRSAARS